MSLMTGSPAVGSAHIREPRRISEQLIYFSSISENTHRFMLKLRRPSERIPLRRSEADIVAERDYVLVLPTYGGEKGEHSIPPQVLRFLREPANREHLMGVIGAGNTNFGANYNIAAHKVSKKLQIPVLYLFELMGTPDDVARVNEGLDLFWTRHSRRPR